jgi:hypothetical protein
MTSTTNDDNTPLADEGGELFPAQANTYCILRHFIINRTNAYHVVTKHAIDDVIL